MAEYCENCGAELRDGSKFCQECGSEVSEENNFCPNCGESIADSENFCENCGTNLNAPQAVEKEDLMEKYRIPILIVLLAVTIVFAAVAIPMITDYSIGSQIVDVDGNDFKIPANFEFNKEKSEAQIEDVSSEDLDREIWENGDEHIQIAVIHYDPGTNVEKIMVSLGGYRDEKYGISGHHYHFEDGDEAFSYAKGNDMISIIVSNSNLYNKIEPV